MDLLLILTYSALRFFWIAVNQWTVPSAVARDHPQDPAAHEELAELRVHRGTPT
jgi:hypothetical protein